MALSYSASSFLSVSYRPPPPINDPIPVLGKMGLELFQMEEELFQLGSRQGGFHLDGHHLLAVQGHKIPLDKALQESSPFVVEVATGLVQIFALLLERRLCSLLRLLNLGGFFTVGCWRVTFILHDNGQRKDPAIVSC